MTYTTQEMSPFYGSLLSTIPFQTVSLFRRAITKSGVQSEGKYRFKDVGARHWEKLGKTLGFRPDFVRRQISTMNDRVVEAAVLLSGELNKNPETASPIYKRITSVINSN